MISIIIPVYNVAEYLSKCIDSILMQTYEDFEIILINDGSKDASGEICNKYEKIDNRIRVFHRENAGVSVTRNFGIEQANGEWIFFVDSDDWIHPRTIELAMKAIDDDDEICFIGIKETSDEECQFDELNLNNLDMVQITGAEFKNLQFRILNRDRHAICNRDLIKVSSPCKFYKRGLIKNNRIRFPVGLPNGEDGVFNLYAYRFAKKAVAIENPIYFYRQREDSVTRKYTANVENDFHKLHVEYRRFLETEERKIEFLDVLDERLIWSFSFCCILKYCHPDNPNSYTERKRSFLETLQDGYIESIERVKLDNFGLTKKILFWAIKKRFFLLVSVLCYFYNKR